MKRKVLVVGGAGYIGSHVCKALAESNYYPVTYDNMVNGHSWAVKWGPLEVGDISDEGRLDQVIKKYRPEIVMHFAAFAYVGESVYNPMKYYCNNVAGTLSLLKVLINNKIDKLVFSSTCATYGVPEKVPLSEKCIQNPINPYGRSKLMVEKILKDFDNAYHLKSISLRYFNATGADPAGEIGECHEPETHLIPLILDVASGRREHIQIFGDDYETVDGTCVRDYIHVADIANAHVLALEKLLCGGGTASYNLSNGRGYSVKEVIQAACYVTGEAIPVITVPKRPGDPPILIGDAIEISRELGWKPRYISIDEQVSHAWLWHSKYNRGSVKL